VFVSERGAPLSAAGFSRMIERAAIAADLGIKAHAHMLRHACHKLANDGHDTRAIQAYLGHRNIQNTTRYTALAPQRFKGFFGTELTAKIAERATSAAFVLYPCYNFRAIYTIGGDGA
jgi:site-specific recombinase XerD